MKREGLIRVAYFAALEVFGDASVRNVMTMCRRINDGHGVRQDDVRRWLSSRPETRPEMRPETKRDTLGTQAGHDADTHRLPETLVKSMEFSFADTPPDTPRTPSRARHKVLESEEIGTSPSVSSKPQVLVGASPPTIPRRRRAKNDADTSWVEPLLTAARLLEFVTLSALTGEQRMILARYHCWRFGNCTVSERHNRARALAVASGIAGLALDRRFGQLLVGEYVACMHAAWTAGGEIPNYQPWNAKTFVVEAKTTWPQQLNHDLERGAGTSSRPRSGTPGLKAVGG